MDSRTELQYIIDRVTRHDNGRASAKSKMRQWEAMYRLDAGYGRTLKEAVMAGQEQITLPTPFNTINLSQRILSSIPRVDVIPSDPTDMESVYNAERCEKWLTCMWDEINFIQQRNVIEDVKWDVLARGRWAVDVKWVKDRYPPALRGLFPIAIRRLDPYDVGVQRGPLYTEYAYHMPSEGVSLMDIVREWPDLMEAGATTALGKRIASAVRNNWRDEDETVRYIDYWAIDPKTGKVMNAVIVEDEYAKPLADSGYPDIPIIVGRGDYAPGIGDEYDGLSINHSIDGLWQYQCRLASQQATIVMWDAWPAVTVQNETGQIVDDIEIGPGSTTPLPWGTKVEMHHLNPNYQLVASMDQRIGAAIEQSTYSSVMWGQGADLDSGYAASLFHASAKGRIKAYQESLEMGLSHVNRVVLALVSKKGGKKGVDIGVVDARDRQKYKLNLNRDMIGDNYQTKVHIDVVVPRDDASRLALMKQYADSKYISAQTLRDAGLGQEVPSDEAKLIALEELMQSDEMRPWRLRRAAEEFFKEGAMDMLFGTPLMPDPPEGSQWTKRPDGKVMLEPLKPQVPPPTANGLPMNSGPLPSPTGMPPMPGGLPPGGPPSPGPMLPPTGPPIQPPGMGGPLGGGFPSHMMGQLEGENLGLPQNVNPATLDAILNTQGSPDAQLRVAAGLPPNGLPQ